MQISFCHCEIDYFTHAYCTHIWTIPCDNQTNTQLRICNLMGTGLQSANSLYINPKAAGCLRNTGIDPRPHWKITKLPSQHLMLGRHWPAIETPVQ